MSPCGIPTGRDCKAVFQRVNNKNSMDILFNSKFLNHNPDSFGEGPYRIKDFEGKVPEMEYNGEEHITLVHSKDYKDYIRKACMDGGTLAEVQISPESYEAACLAVGLTIKASMQNDFAIVRPPGHHAKYERADGFCLFNNIAIATQKLVNEGEKVFILDIDGHHGDGTQSFFYRSDRVLYCSMHQQYTYPWSGETYETGEGPGKGYTMNFPLPAGSRDEHLINAVHRAIERAVEFKPYAVGVSAGFDGYEKDRLLGLKYTQDGYYQCGLLLGRNFERVFAVLEGGYHNDIKICVEKFIDGIHQAKKDEV